LPGRIVNPPSSGEALRLETEFRQAVDVMVRVAREHGIDQALDRELEEALS